jgi:hypothetical protein
MKKVMTKVSARDIDRIERSKGGSLKLTNLNILSTRYIENDRRNVTSPMTMMQVTRYLLCSSNAKDITNYYFYNIFE